MQEALMFSATGGKLELPVLLVIVSRSQSVISLVRKPLYESHTAYWFIVVFNVIIALFNFIMVSQNCFCILLNHFKITLDFFCILCGLSTCFINPSIGK